MTAIADGVENLTLAITDFTTDIGAIAAHVGSLARDVGSITTTLNEAKGARESTVIKVIKIPETTLDEICKSKGEIFSNMLDADNFNTTHELKTTPSNYSRQDPQGYRSDF
jgi:hypothetical protein